MQAGGALSPRPQPCTPPMHSYAPITMHSAYALLCANYHALHLYTPMRQLPEEQVALSLGWELERKGAAVWNLELVELVNTGVGDKVLVRINVPFGA
jgi:hypothetical protein